MAYMWGKPRMRLGLWLEQKFGADLHWLEDGPRMSFKLDMWRTAWPWIMVVGA